MYLVFFLKCLSEWRPGGTDCGSSTLDGFVWYCGRNETLPTDPPFFDGFAFIRIEKDIRILVSTLLLCFFLFCLWHSVRNANICQSLADVGPLRHLSFAPLARVPVAQPRVLYRHHGLKVFGNTRTILYRSSSFLSSVLLLLPLSPAVE